MFKLPEEVSSNLIDYVKERLNSVNSLIGHKLQNIFKYFFLEFFQKSFETELGNHLRYLKHQQDTKINLNRRNDYSAKQLKSEVAGEFSVKVPRGRKDSYGSEILGKHETSPSYFGSKTIVIIQGELGWLCLGLFITTYANILLR
ncbi:MAG: transposase [Candidatus Delongbacteria bacterium]|nr:transposase [Candidatus Delongbacteria bacterium]MBN2834381.1 transposase [Candidatus Delongbacteria bacterium]